MPSGTRWQLVVRPMVRPMVATMTRARIRQTAAEPEEDFPPFSLKLWDPLEVLDPLLNDLEPSPFFFFFFVFLLFPRLSSLADGAAGFGGCWRSHPHDDTYLPFRTCTLDSYIRETWNDL